MVRYVVEYLARNFLTFVGKANLVLHRVKIGRSLGFWWCAIAAFTNIRELGAHTRALLAWEGETVEMPWITRISW